MRDLLPAERVSVQQSLVALDARTQRAMPNEIRWHIGKLLSHWDTNQAAQVKEAIIADWRADLIKAGYSAVVIAEACEEWRTTQTYRPKVAEILQICRNIVARDGEHARRAKVLLGLEPPSRLDRARGIKPAEEKRASASITRDIPKDLHELGEQMKARRPVIPGAIIPRDDARPKPIETGRPNTNADELLNSLARRTGKSVEELRSQHPLPDSAA